MAMYANTDSLHEDLRNCLLDLNKSEQPSDENSATDHLDAQLTKSELLFVELISSFLIPSFGSQSKSEMLLDIFHTLGDLGYINLKTVGGSDSSSPVFEIVQKLRITNSRARKLVYDHNLRTNNPEELPGKARELLSQPLFRKKEDEVCFEVNDPYLADYLKNEARKLGVLTDGSFSSSLITLNTEGFVKLVEEFLTEEDDRETYEEIIKAVDADLNPEEQLNLDKGDASGKGIAGLIKRIIEGTITQSAADGLEAVLGNFDGSQIAALLNNVLRIFIPS